MQSSAFKGIGLLAVWGLVLGSPPEAAPAAPVKPLSPQCENVEFTSAQSLFECMATIRHRNGVSKFQKMDGSRCAEVLGRFFREIGRPGALRDETQPVPSCKVVAEVAELMTGNTPYWSACTDYPAPDSNAHMRKCMQAFVPAYYGARGFEKQIGTCEGFKRGYEIALKSANNRHNQKVPQGYRPPTCDAVNEVIASVTGGAIQWPGCANYDPTKVREHLLACVAAEPRESLRWRDCRAVRMAYEERLRATHGGLPSDYAIVSCDDAQAVLDKAVAYKKAQEAERIRRAEAAKRERESSIEREREKVEAARAKILAKRKATRAARPACDPGPNRYPDHEYGDVLSALEASCAPTLSPKAQLFAAGLGEGLVKQCSLPRSVEDRMRVAKFVAASVQVGVGGGQYSNPDYTKMMGDQAASQAAYSVGVMTFRGLEGCNSRAAVALADGLARYLAQTAAQSTWVDGCELQYAGRYSRGQCQCMADSIRALDPDIHARQFSRGSIQSLSARNPVLTLQMATQCGIGDY